MKIVGVTNTTPNGLVKGPKLVIEGFANGETTQKIIEMLKEGTLTKEDHVHISIKKSQKKGFFINSLHKLMV